MRYGNNSVIRLFHKLGTGYLSVLGGSGRIYPRLLFIRIFGVARSQIGNINCILTMKCLTGIPEASHNLILSLTECAREFQNNAFWDTPEHV